MSRTKTPARLALASGIAMLVTSVVTGGEASAAESPVGLGTATSFAILAGQTATNTGPSVITGDIGVSPGSEAPGFGPPTVVNGVFHLADAEAAQAQSDLTVAYNDAAGRATTATVGPDLAGTTLVSGVYTGTTLGLTGTVTLDAQGDPDAVWVFQAAETLITSTVSVVALTNGASPCNVYWQVGSSATLGTDSTFVGTVLALTSITATTGADVQGRLLARNGAVTLDTNTVTRPSCATIPPGTTTTVAPTTVAPTTTTVAGTTTTVASTTTTTAAPTTTTTAAPTTTTTAAPTTTSTAGPVPTTSTTAPATGGLPDASTTTTRRSTGVGGAAPLTKVQIAEAAAGSGGGASTGAGTGRTSTGGSATTGSDASTTGARSSSGARSTTGTLPTTGTSAARLALAGLLLLLVGAVLLRLSPRTR